MSRTSIGSSWLKIAGRIFRLLLRSVMRNWSRLWSNWNERRFRWWSWSANSLRLPKTTPLLLHRSKTGIMSYRRNTTKLQLPSSKLRQKSRLLRVIWNNSARSVRQWRKPWGKSKSKRQLLTRRLNWVNTDPNTALKICRSKYVIFLINKTKRSRNWRHKSNSWRANGNPNNFYWQKRKKQPPTPNNSGRNRRRMPNWRKDWGNSPSPYLKKTRRCKACSRSWRMCAVLIY